jgi:hypothetical protein
LRLLTRGAARFIVSLEDDRVQLRVERLGARDRFVHHFAGGHFLLGDRLREAERIKPGIFAKTHAYTLILA